MIEKRNPATLELVGEVPEIDPAMVPSVVEAARRAQTEWASWPLERRKRSLRQAQQRMLSRLEEIARLVCQETGKPRIEAINNDLLTALNAGEYSLRSVRRLFEPRRLSFENLGPMMSYLGRSSYLQNRPLGVVGIIAPWNYPFGLPYSQTIMAVAAGNAVILKPSSETPLTGLEIAKLFAGEDFPEGLVHALIGPGTSVGKALIGSGVDRLIFTGSTRAGAEVMAQASQRLTPVTLELGGKDPFVVFADADLERAAEAAVWGGFVNAGQTCVCVKRIYAQAAVYDRFVDRLVARVGGLKVGDGWDDPEVSVGPLINERAVREMEAAVDRAVRDGAKVLVGGRRVPDLKGHFFQPTVIVDAPQECAVVQEEVFGPLVTVNRFGDEDEAVRLANDCPYALSGSVWTRDLAKGERVAGRLSGGTVLVNNVAYTYGLAMTPWGGRGMSGFGRTHGELGFSELVEVHHVHVDKGRFPREVWWHPYDRSKLQAGRGMIDLLFVGGTTRKLTAMRRIRKIMKGR